MSYKIQKPRLAYFQGLLSFDEPNLDEIKRDFVYWALYIEYLIFRKENIYTFEKEWKAVKAAKRGNDVYARRLRGRLKILSRLPRIECFKQKDRSRRHTTRVLFITLTRRREGRLDVVWKGIVDDFNRWISGLRRRFGRIHVLRAWEANDDGYPHVHCVLYFEESEFETFFYNGKWRVQMKHEIAKNWRWGFVDVIALSSLGAGVGYVTKYLTKVHDALEKGRGDHKAILTLAMMWIFRKRAYSISRGFEDLLGVEEGDKKRAVLGQVDLEGNPIHMWVLVGFWAGDLGLWSKRLSYKEFFKMYSSYLFTPNSKL